VLTQSEKSLRSKIAAHESWGHTDDRSARTSNGRRAFLDRFEKQADPNNELTAAERARRAESLKNAYFARLALKSAKSRRLAKESRLEADRLEDEAAVAETELAQAGGDVR
jgi:hypothetical protein